MTSSDVKLTLRKITYKALMENAYDVVLTSFLSTMFENLNLAS